MSRTYHATRRSVTDHAERLRDWREQIAIFARFVSWLERRASRPGEEERDARGTAKAQEILRYGRRFEERLARKLEEQLSVLATKGDHKRRIKRERRARRQRQQFGLG